MEKGGAIFPITFNDCGGIFPRRNFSGQKFSHTKFPPPPCILGPNLPVLLRKPGQSLNPGFVVWPLEFPFSILYDAFHKLHAHQFHWRDMECRPVES